MKRKKTLSQFKINQLNINGLCSVAKQRELQARLKSSKSEIVIISDTRLNQKHNTNLRSNIRG